MEESHVCHYGLVAKYLPEFIDSRETPFFLQEIAQNCQPILYLECDTRRLFLSLLQAEIDIDGCCISGDNAVTLSEKGLYNAYFVRIFIYSRCMRLTFPADSKQFIL